MAQKCICPLFFFFLSVFLYPEDQFQLINVIKLAWEHSTEAEIYRQDYVLSQLNYDLKITDWKPSISIIMPQSLTHVSGINTYIDEQSLTTSGRNIYSTGIIAKLEQKTSYNGLISLSTAYSTSRIVNQTRYLQFPKVSLNIEQPLCPDFFRLNSDPEKKILQLELTKGLLEYNNQKGLFIVSCLDIINSQIVTENIYQYQNILDKALTQKKVEFETLYEQGRLSDSDLLQCTQDMLSKHRDLLTASYNADIANTHFVTFFHHESIFITSKMLDQFSLLIPNTFLESSFELQKLSNQLLSDETRYRINLSKYAPVLSFGVLTEPDTDAYYIYSTWKRSWDNLFSDSPFLKTTINLSFSFNTDTFNEKKVQEDIYNQNKIKILTTIDSLKEQQVKNSLCIQKYLNSLQQYYNQLLIESNKQDTILEDYRKLFIQGQITESDYLFHTAQSKLVENERTEVLLDIIRYKLQLCLLNGTNFDSFLN